MAANLVAIPEVEHLSSRVIRILGGNPGKFTLQGTNTYLLGTGSRRILIDTGEGKPIWKTNLEKVLKDEKAIVSKAIITHWHPDHVGGIPALKALCPSVTVYKYNPDNGQESIEDGQTFSESGASLKAVHSPGHTQDHISMLLEEEDNAIFTGDNVLGQGTAVFEDLALYLSSLRKMLDCKPSKGYPAHGPTFDNAQDKIKEYISHRQQREDQIVAVLKENTEPIGSMDIVKVIYVEIPDTLHLAAERGVLQVLAKLEGEGRVRDQDNKYVWMGDSKF